MLTHDTCGLAQGSIPKTNMEIFNGICHYASPPLHPFLPHFFSFAIESYLYETDFTPGLSQNYHS